MQDKTMEMAALAEENAGDEAPQKNALEGVEATIEEERVLSADELVEELKVQLAKAEVRVDELTDQLQRTAAEFQNSRRRQERQLAEEIERASGHLLKRILPVMDDLNLAFSNVPPEVAESQAAWLDGFRQIQKKLYTVLEDEGVTEVPPDGMFDPTRHEAVTSEPHEQVPSGHIIETLRAGYEYKGRVLRPALVRVAL
jgi:molecular chaperone GrpE